MRSRGLHRLPVAEMESLRIVLSAVFLNVISVMRHLSRYALWQDIFKIVIPFMYCAMISFHCVVNNDPGVDKYTQEGLEVNSGFSQKWYQSRCRPSRVALLINGKP